MIKQTDLIESIYMTADDSGRWVALLHDLVTATASRSARLLVMNTEANLVTSSFKVNIDDHDHCQYADYYVNKCPWRPELRRMPPGRLYSSFLHFSCRQPDFYKSEFFNDWARQLDIHHGLCGTVYRDSRQTVQLLIQRTEGQGHYTEVDSSFVNSLVPHMQQSFLVAEKLANSQARAQATAMAATGEALPFMLLDKNLRLVNCSPGAEHLLNENVLLQIKDGKPSIKDERQNRHLLRLLRQCLIATETGDSQSLGGTVRLQRVGLPDLQLLVKPLHPGMRSLIGEPNAFVVIYYYAPDAPVKLDPARLCEIFDLSSAEARVAIALVETPDSYDVARRCTISLHTVRSHIKSIFYKTQASNRAELMKFLLTCPARRL